MGDAVPFEVRSVNRTWDEYVVTYLDVHAQRGWNESVLHIRMDLPLGFFRKPVADKDIEALRLAMQKHWRREVRRLWERTQLRPAEQQAAERRTRRGAELAAAAEGDEG